MTTTLTIKPKILAFALLLSIFGLIFPHASMAQADSGFDRALVFDLSVKPETPTLTMDEIAVNDPLVIAIRTYLESKSSPLAPFAHQIIQQPNWQQAMGIIFVESNYCSKAANFNCGSVGVKPGHKQWRQFESPFEGFKAVTELLEKPMYKNRYNTCKAKLGIYVVPGSRSWLRGCESVEQRMHELVAEAEQQKRVSVVVAASIDLAIIK